MRDEDTAELVVDLAERGLERLRINADNSLTSSSLAAKLSTTASSSRSFAAKRCSVSVSVSFSRSWVGPAGAAEDTPLLWPRPAEARPVVEHPPPLAGARFERVVEAALLVPPGWRHLLQNWSVLYACPTRRTAEKETKPGGHTIIKRESAAAVLLAPAAAAQPQ